MALGATRAGGAMVLGEVRCGTGCIGLAFGLAAAAALSRNLSAMLFGVRPGDPQTLALVLVAMGSVALLATLLPARRASRLDPQTALRQDQLPQAGNAVGGDTTRAVWRLTAGGREEKGLPMNSPFAVGSACARLLQGPAFGQQSVRAEHARQATHRPGPDPRFAAERLRLLPRHALTTPARGAKTGSGSSACPTWGETAFYDDRERAALDWCESLTRLTDPARATAMPNARELKAVFSDQEITELTVVVAIINAWNRLGVGMRGRRRPASPFA